MWGFGRMEREYKIFENKSFIMSSVESMKESASGLSPGTCNQNVVSSTHSIGVQTVPKQPFGDSWKYDNARGVWRNGRGETVVEEANRFARAGLKK